MDATEIAAIMEGKSLDELEAEEKQELDAKPQVMGGRKKEKVSKVKVIFREKGDIENHKKYKKLIAGNSRFFM